MLAHDRYGNNVTDTVTVTATLSPPVDGAVTVTALATDQLSVAVRTTVAGAYSLAVQAADGSHVPGSPFALRVWPAAAALAAYTSDLTGGFAIAHLPRAFRIEGRDIYGNANTSGAGDLAVAVVSGAATAGVVRLDNATFVVPFEGTAQGPVVLSATEVGSGGAVAGSPFTVTVGAGPPVLARFVLTTGALALTAGATVDVSVLPRDSLDNIVGGAVDLALNTTPAMAATASRVAGGPYVWYLQAALAGTVNVNVTLDGAHVPGSPFAVTVAAGAWPARAVCPV
jgi:hypothetical protein